jgi:hypothetical protein
MERGAACTILEQAGFQVVDFVSREDDPPDCEGILDGKWSAVEVTRLTHEKTRARSMKAIKQQAAGREPEKAEAFFIWDRDNLIRSIQELIERKDAVDYKGGPYERCVLIIHTDEIFLSNPKVNEFLEGATFRASRITDAILGLSYEPNLGRYPTFKLNLVPSACTPLSPTS